LADPHYNSSTPFEGLAVREGHFLLESGLHAEAWIDLDTLFLDPQALAPQIAALAALVSQHKISAVCGPLLGGAFVAQAIALQLGVRFYFAERVRSNTHDGLFQAEYRLPNSQRTRAAPERFAVVDDVIGAGSAVRATVSELASLGATTAVVGALLTLGSRAGSHLAQLGIPVVALGSREIAMWEPKLCPRCQAGIPLHSVS
jgi:orotate phosphoribosyltransferase